MKYPIIKNIKGELLSDNIIGVRPDESLSDAYKRFILEKRLSKINNILKRIKKP